MMERLTITLVLAPILALAACENLSRPERTSSDGAASQEKLTATTQKKELSDRFRLLQGSAHLSSGRDVPVILRIDSATGETWSLAAEPNRWVGVEDDLRRAGRYNPKTQKVEWSVKTPDGRDLSELSKEELIRYLSAAIRNGQPPDPNDPLGIRDKPKQ
jgi:hypothetical protein